MKIGSDDLPSRNLIYILLILTVIRTLFAAEIELTEDESYYRLWGLYPSYAYYDHAPMVGWWIAIGQSIFGDTALGLRVLSPIAGFFGSIFIWRIALVSFDRPIADLSVIVFNAMPLIGIGGVMMTPDVPSVFFWGVALWTLVEWTRFRNDVWWLAFGFAAGLGLLSKYSNVFLGLGVIVWLAVSGRWRDAIRTPYFYLAGLIAVLLFSPVVYWNYQNDWASFSKQLGRLQSDTLTPHFLAEWIGGQLLLLSPLIFLAAIGFLIKYGRTYLRSPYAIGLIVSSVLPILIYFALNSLSSRINANWTAPIYSSFAIFAAALIYEYRNRNDRISRGVGFYAAPCGYAITAIILFEAMFGFLPVDRRNPISQIRGYDELATRIQIIYQETGASVIATSRYQATGMLAWKLKGLADVIQLSERIRYLNQPKSKLNIENKSVLYFGRKQDAAVFIDHYRPCYKSARFIEDVNRSDRGVELARYQLWIIEDLDKAVLQNGRTDDCRVGL